jgi:competence protein ComEC
MYRTPLSEVPAFLPLLSFSIFSALFGTYAYPFPAAFIISLLASVGWAALGTGHPNRSSLQVSAVLLVLTFLGLFYISFVISRGDEPPRTVHERGTVLSARKWGREASALVKSASGVFVLRLDAGSGIRTGDVVEFSGVSVPFKRARASREFDERLYWLAKGASSAVQVSSCKAAGRSLGPAAWRDSLSRRISEVLPPRTAGYALASLTGERDEILSELHRSVGTSHILAVSGFHVGIAFAVCWFFMKRFRFRLYAISAAIWLYVLLAGASPSSLRAAFMIEIMIAGRVVGRLGNGFNSACAAGSAMLLANPWLFWDIGWRLSMLAVLAITALARSELSRPVKAALASPLAWLATSVQAAWTFGSVPLAGLAANFLSLPAFAILFPVSWILSLPALLGIPGGSAASAVAEFLFERWEVLSLNILVLFPWETSFSNWLVLLCAPALTYFFAGASGFSQTRAAFASGISLAGVFLLL